MSSKESLEELAHPEYWNQRYSETAETEEKYDWLRTFDAIRPFLVNHLPVNLLLNLYACAILTRPQTLSKDLHSIGYANQISVDFSPVVIDQMSKKHPDMEWKVEDVRKMSFEDASIDIAIDKATLDAMLYGSLWDPEDEVKKNVGAYVDEVARVLKPGGLWLYITWRQPHFIKPLLAREGVWTVDSETLADGGGMFEYYGYVIKKGS